MQISEKQIEAARDKFKELSGIQIYLPGEGTLDDFEQERYDALVAALTAALSTDAEPVAYRVRMAGSVWQLRHVIHEFDKWDIVEPLYAAPSALSAQVQDVAGHREIIARFFSEMWERSPGSLTADEYMEAGGAHKQADELLARLPAAPAAKLEEKP